MIKNVPENHKYHTKLVAKNKIENACQSNILYIFI